MSTRLLACSILLSAVAFTQQTGRITGTVIDSNGIFVSGANVQARNSGSGALVKASSSAKGQYAISAPAGTYDVTVAVPGLKAYLRKGVAVEAGKTVALEIRLEDTTQLSTLGEDRFAVAADLKKHAPPSGPSPQTADGKPDLSGVWWTPATIDSGKPEFLPWAEKLAEARADNLRKDNPQARCLPSPILRLGPIYEFVQGRLAMVEMVDDDSPGFHRIYLDGRSHPADPNPAWYGHNVGHWEGDTLVVDRIGFDERAVLDQDLHPHTDKLHIIERYRRPDMGHLETEVTVEDPGILAKPWTFKRVSDLAPTEELYEFICPENNKDVPHMVGK